MNPTDSINSDNTVINLSDVELTAAELQLLTLGLSFCSGNGFKYVQTRVDLFKLIRKLNLMKHFKLNKATEIASQIVTQNVPSSTLLVSDIGTLRSMHALAYTEDDSGRSTSDHLQTMGIQGTRHAISPFQPPSSFIPLMPKDAFDTFSECVIEELKQLNKGFKQTKTEETY